MTSSIQSAPVVGASSQESETSSEPPSSSSTQERFESEPEPDPQNSAGPAVAPTPEHRELEHREIDSQTRPRLHAVDGGLLLREAGPAQATLRAMQGADDAPENGLGNGPESGPGNGPMLRQDTAPGDIASEQPWIEDALTSAAEGEAQPSTRKLSVVDSNTVLAEPALGTEWPEVEGQMQDPSDEGFELQTLKTPDGQKPEAEMPEAKKPEAQTQQTDPSAPASNGPASPSACEPGREALSDKAPPPAAALSGGLALKARVLDLASTGWRTLVKLLARMPRPELRWRRPNGESEDTAEPESSGETQETATLANAAELLLLDNIRALRTARVEDVRVPRADITFITNDMSLDDIVAKAKEAGHSRFPVMGENQDEVLGMIHIKDLLWGDVDPQHFRVQDFMRDVLFVAPSMPVLQLLQDMQVKRHHMALIVDEFGGIDGLVTIEDLVEEIVGDISDEYDTDRDPALMPQADGTWVIDARYRIDELEELIGDFLTDDEREEDIDTLGGLLTHIAGRVPTRNELIEHKTGMRFQVVDADPRRIKRLRMRAKSLAGAKGLVSQSRAQGASA